MPHKATIIVMSVVFLLQSSCGTLLYPERKGQLSGRIDPVVAILNGVGVLFYVIPGLAAFGVDFYTGAIYLPRGYKRRALAERSPSELSSSEIRQKIIEGKLDKAGIEGHYYELSGQRIDLSSPAWRVESLPDISTLEQRLEAFRAQD